MLFLPAPSPENCSIKGRNQNLNLPKNQMSMFIFLVFLLFFNAKAQSSTSQDDSQDAVTAFQPSLAVVIGILSIMFSLTFVLLIYAKFCHRISPVHISRQNQDGLNRSMSRLSGIEKTVIESLPFFKFSLLKGAREGLECSVCLSKFEDIEVLRLLPKCKHAFHTDCVDQWLEKHSSCPLCRQKVSVEDLAFFTNSSSLRFLRSQSELREDSNLEIFVEREEDHNGSLRYSNGRSFRGFEKGKKEEELPIQQSCDFDENREVLHKFNHKIIVSDVVLKNRWSSVSSSDLMFLNSEMINAMSSNRFSPMNSNNEKFTTKNVLEDGKIVKIKEEMERKREFESKVSKIQQTDLIQSSGISSTTEFKVNSGYNSKVMSPTQKRSMSEITVHPRVTEFSRINSSSIESSFPENNVKEERLRRLWLPIARRTVQWFANRDRRSPQSQNTRQSLNV